MSITIKRGNYYKRRDGVVVGPITRNRCDSPYAVSHPWYVHGTGPFTDEGRWTEDESRFDLIEEVPAPSAPMTPAEAARRIAALDQGFTKGVGDVTSDARGSGARFNTGKPPMELIPVWLLARQFKRNPYLVEFIAPLELFERLGSWQTGNLTMAEVLDAVPDAWLTDCARVFDYGRKKYAEWNWAKGMAWSVPLGCAVRHLLAILRGEENDPESGLPHRGHVLCNLVMLAQYEQTYREGDDRPIQWLSTAKTA